MLLGQAESLRQSRVGLTIAREVAGDLEGDVGAAERALVDAGALFYGISVTNVALPQLEHLSAITGGRFEVVAGADEVVAELTGIAEELAGQYVVSYAPPPAAATRIDVAATGSVVATRVAATR